MSDSSYSDALVFHVQRALREAAGTGHDVTSDNDPYSSRLWGKSYPVQHKSLILLSPVINAAGGDHFVPFSLESHVPLARGGGLVVSTHKQQLEMGGPTHSNSSFSMSLPVVNHTVHHFRPFTAHAPGFTMHGHEPSEVFDIDKRSGNLTSGYNYDDLLKTNPNDIKQVGMDIHEYIKNKSKESHGGFVLSGEGFHDERPMSDDDYREHLRATQVHGITPSFKGVVESHPFDLSHMTGDDRSMPIPEGMTVPRGALHVIHMPDNPGGDTVINHYAYHPDTEKLVNLDPMEGWFNQ